MASEHDYLIGGRITAVKESPDVDGWSAGGDVMTTLTVTFPRQKTITIEGDTIRVKSVDLEIWQDEEGNGAGALVLVSAMEVLLK